MTQSPRAGFGHRKCFLKHEYLQQTNGKSSPKQGLSPIPSISQRMATKPGGISDSSQHIFNFDHLTNSFSECYSSNEHLEENLDCSVSTSRARVCWRNCWEQLNRTVLEKNWLEQKTSIWTFS